MGLRTATYLHEHDAGLVALSVLAAVIAGYAAFDLAQRAARTADRGERHRRLMLAAVTMGIGIWSMHFIGMLALDLGFPVSYHVGLMLLSMGAAIAGAGIALAVVTSSQASLRSVFLGAAFMGLAVAAMHYIGMASMEMPARIDWGLPLVVLSLAIAYLASLLALALVFNLHAGQRWRVGPLALAALVFGIAVAGLHYTGMFAATFVELSSGPVVAGGADTEMIAILLGIAAAVMLVVLLFGANVDRQRAAFARDLTFVAEMMRDVVQSPNARESICAAAAELTGARFVALLEPGYGGLLERTAAHGETAVEHGIGHAQGTFDSGRRRFRPGEGGSHSSLYEPILLDERRTGVLFLVWPYSLRRLSDRAVTIAGLLAAEASFAIDRADMLSRLERQATTDELTGLSNRRAVRSELADRLAASGEGQPTAVVMLDLDHFKSYNDRYGHHGGDRLLEAAAEGWTAQLRGDDRIGRYGGEEFLVVLPECSLRNAVAAADRLRSALPAGVTCSAGVAVWDGEETDDALVARADGALYEAKRLGRDRTETAGTTAPFDAQDSPAAATADPFGRFVSDEGIQSFLDGLGEAFAQLDDHGLVGEWNRPAEAMLGWTREEALGSELATMLASPELRAAHRETLEGDGHGPTFDLRVRIRSGGTLPVEMRLSQVDAGDESAVVVFIRDVSDRRATEERLRQLESMVSSSEDAIFTGSMDGTIKTWNPAAERLYGYPASEMIGENVARLKLAGDPENADAKRGRAIREGRSVSMEATERRRDGSPVTVAATVAPLRDDDGEVTGFGVIARDVTERKAAEARLAQAHSQFAGAFGAAAIGMALVGLDGSLRAVNGALCALLQRDEEELLASSFQELTHPDDLGADVRQLERAVAGEIDSYRLSKRYLLPDGGIVWGLLTVSVVRDADGEPLHFVSQVQDIADRMTAEGELQRYTRQLESMSSRDPLTGLANRRALISSLSEEMNVFAAGGKQSSLLLIAIDGDEAAISAAAARAAASARDGDLVAHLGGGELAVLLSGVGSDAAERILARAREALTTHPVRFATVTARRGDDADALLSRARQALTDSTPADGGEAAMPHRVRGLLELARRQLGMPLSFLTRLEGDEYVFERIAGDPSQFGFGEGAVMPLDGTHCVLMLDGRIESVVQDLAADPETQDLAVTTELGLRAYAGVPVQLRSGEVYGTLCAVDTRPHPELTERQTELLRFISALTAEAIDSAAEEHAARRAETSANGVRALLVALEARDLYTGDHSKEVVGLAAAVARRLGLAEDEVRDVEQVALLHDVGKVGIPDAVLQKQGPLDEVEWQLMRQHPIVGERIIGGTPGLTHLAPAMRAEHERWDGGGYPDGLAGAEIPIASRITLACDAFHAMTSDRPYRPAMTVECACEELRKHAGTQFDPAVATALLAEIGSSAGRVPSAATR